MTLNLCSLRGKEEAGKDGRDRSGSKPSVTASPAARVQHLNTARAGDPPSLCRQRLKTAFHGAQTPINRKSQQ